MKPPQISVIIPTRNRADLLEKTIGSISRQGIAPDDIEVIVSDNCSTDGTQECITRLGTKYPFDIRYHCLTSNGGPARSRNVGAQLARGSMLAFIDSDVELASGCLLSLMNVFHTRPDVGLAGCKILFQFRPDLVNSYGGHLSRIGLAWDAHEGEPHEQLTGLANRLWVNTTCVAVRKCAFESVGGFDEIFFAAHEDSDLGWRLNLAGWRCVCKGEAFAYHAASEYLDDTARKNDDQLTFHYCKNRLRSMLKNYSLPNLVRYLPLYLGFVVTDLVVHSQRDSKWRALWWNLRMLPDTLRFRAVVQGARKVPDSELMPLFYRSLFPPERLHRRNERFRQMPTTIATRVKGAQA